jgi:Fic-DOC domain mobile mystery protein B
MSDLNRPGPPGSTPLDPNESDGLIPAWVATRDELNEAEQSNILKAIRRRRWQRCSVEELLDDKAARDLHRDMFGEVWRWAGHYRSTETSVGVDPRTISVRVRDLMADARVWLSPPTSMPLDHVAYEFHHKLVHIHPFPNGNGRHARQMTDILLRAIGQPPFSWGSASLDDDGATGAAYIAALRAADHGDYQALAAFVRS